jgi:hypothetical protein
MGNINIRNVPGELYYRVRSAAAMGGQRIPKGGLQHFVIRALWRAVEDPQPGAGLPRLKLCAQCVKANQARVVPQSKVAPAHNFQVAPVILEPKPPVGAAKGLFKHLLKK